MTTEKQNNQDTVLIPLPNFCFHNHPGHQNNLPDATGDTGADFIGRTTLLKRFVDAHQHAHARRGSFLVAGFRGAGKTAFVKQGIAQYKQEIRKGKETPKEVLDIHINLGNDSKLHTKDVLSDMVSLLRQKIDYPPHIRKLKGGIKLFLLITLLIIIFVLPLLGALLDYNIYDGVYKHIKDNMLKFGIISISISFILYIISRDIIKSSTIKTIQQLKQLEKSIAGHTEQKTSIANYGLHIGKKYSRPPLSIREIESQLMEIIQEASKKIRIIFIFDELDKLIDDTSNDSAIPTSITNTIHYERKHHVEQLLGGLKNLVTTSQAQYIFIAGREVLDDYHGEHASRSPLYESLFTNTFYVPSLLTDDSDADQMHIASMTEVFVISKLLGMQPELGDLSLNRFYQVTLQQIEKKKKKKPRS